MHIFLLAISAVAAVVEHVAAQAPSFPNPITGNINCALPIGQLICTADSRSGFVAGLEFGPGPGYGLRSVCARGANSTAKAKTYYPELQQQTTWDMTNLEDPNFPRNTDGQPDLAYYYPLGGLITQMIVLEAVNAWGSRFGQIPAVIFRYYHPDTQALHFAVCGNSRYAQAYLDPLGATARPPPTTPMLRSVYVNPLSATTAAFLASFQAKCSGRGFGFLDGDPHQQSVFHVEYFKRVCFAPVAAVDTIEPPGPPPALPDTEPLNITRQACYWDKRKSSQGPSVSCVRNGDVVATGKYGVIMLDGQQNMIQAVQDRRGTLVAAAFSGPPYQGSMPDVSIT